MVYPWRTAWIVGASTGIGRELALKLARAGVKVAISARTAEKLDDLARLQDGLLPVPVDIAKKDDVAVAHAKVVAALGPPDLVVLNAGIWFPFNSAMFDAGKVTEAMTVNYLGMANVLEPAIPAMVARRGGQIALVASVAGYRGLPRAVAYSPTKAAIISLAEVLRLELTRHGVVVSFVCPGFVETPLTAENTFRMPFILKVEDAAERILRGLRKGKFEIAFPWQLAWPLKLVRIMPNWLYLWLGTLR